MSDWEFLFKTLTHKGFFSLRKILQYALPNKNEDGPKITDKPWVRISAFVAPLIAMAMLYKIHVHPPEILTLFPMAGTVIHKVVVCYAAFFFLVLLLCSLLLKMYNRNASLLLCLTPFAPLKAFVLFSVLNFLFVSSGIAEKKARMSRNQEQFSKKTEQIKFERAKLNEQLTKGIEKFETDFKERKETIHKHLDKFNENFDEQANAVKNQVKQQFADYFQRKKEASDPEVREKQDRENWEKFQAKIAKRWEEHAKHTAAGRWKQREEDRAKLEAAEAE